MNANTQRLIDQRDEAQSELRAAHTDVRLLLNENDTLRSANRALRSLVERFVFMSPVMERDALMAEARAVLARIDGGSVPGACIGHRENCGCMTCEDARYAAALSAVLKDAVDLGPNHTQSLVRKTLLDKARAALARKEG
jgi:hypothetical protein